MFYRILKKDLKRKKTMNTILLLFIVLASMFVAAGLNNVITVVNGTDYYLDRAGVEDVTFITTGDDSVGHLQEYLKNNDAVSSFKIESVLFGSNNNVYLLNGEEANTKNTCIFMKLSDRGLNYYNKDNQLVENVESGHLYVSGKFMESNHLKDGEKIKIKHNSFEKEMIVDGKIKDALLGSDFMGNTRFFLSDEDYDLMLEDDAIKTHYRGEIGYVNLKDGEKLLAASSKVPGITFEGPRSTIKMCYVMDMIVAFMILILSICLIVISFVVLKFSINFTIQEEFREIGVMKAIGLRNAQIRRLYIGKYLVMALIGAFVGFLASIPFAKMLIKSVSENMMLGNSLGVLINAIGAVLVILVIVLFAYQCTGKVKKSSPIDAIRSGQTGERYKKKSVFRIGKSHVGNNLYLAINDILSSPKRFLTIIFSFCLCTLFVLLLVNTVETMDSPNLIGTFGVKSDIYVDDLPNAMKFMNGKTKEEYIEYLNERADELTKMGMPAKAEAEIQYKYVVTFNGENYTYTCQQGANTTADMYDYTEGKIPMSETEIAITPQVSKKTGAKIGDIITIDFGEEKLDCMVVAYFETMNQLGEVIRLQESAPTDFKYIANIMPTQYDFTDNPNQKEIDRRRDDLKDYFGTNEVLNAREYCVKETAAVDILRAVQYLLCGITLVVIILVTVLMERSFIADEKSQIAILKAIGFKNKDIIKWQVYRFGIIAFISALFAAILSIPMTKICITPIFGMMGATKIKYNIVPYKVFGIYPGIVVLATCFIALITAQYTRTISSRDTANIE